MSKNGFPDFIIAGPPRSSSTYLMENIASHPDVYIPAGKGGHSTGDLHFFDVVREEGINNYNKGEDWYKNNFLGAGDDVLVGEKTADYFCDEIAPQLIKESCGLIKIIVTLRNPVDRLYSHFWHVRHGFGFFTDFSSFLAKGKDIGDHRVFHSSYYYEPLLRFYETFGEENVCVLIYDELKDSPEKTLKYVCDFLGLDKEFCFSKKNILINEGFYSIKSYVIGRAAFLMKSKANSLYQLILSSFFGEWFSRYFAKKRGVGSHSSVEVERHAAGSGYPEMNEADREILMSLYRSDVENVSAVLKKDLLGLWRMN